jgi:hypothetical protein
MGATAPASPCHREDLVLSVVGADAPTTPIAVEMLICNCMGAIAPASACHREDLVLSDVEADAPASPGTSGACRAGSAGADAPAVPVRIGRWTGSGGRILRGVCASPRPVLGFLASVQAPRTRGYRLSRSRAYSQPETFCGFRRGRSCSWTWGTSPAFLPNSIRRKASAGDGALYAKNQVFPFGMRAVAQVSRQGRFFAYSG